MLRHSRRSESLSTNARGDTTSDVAAALTLALSLDGQGEGSEMDREGIKNSQARRMTEQAIEHDRNRHYDLPS